MAKRLRNLLARHSILLLVHVILAGCVSTDELYAPYDAVDCNVIIERRSGGELIMRDLIANTHFLWHPAVYFDYDEHVLDTENVELLSGTAIVLDQYPALNLALQGFTDLKGSPVYNQALAKRRVMTVIGHLVDLGVSADRIVSQPLGEGLRQFGSDEALSRSINRRVQLMLLDEVGRPVRLLHTFEGL